MEGLLRNVGCASATASVCNVLVVYIGFKAKRLLTNDLEFISIISLTLTSLIIQSVEWAIARVVRLSQPKYTKMLKKWCRRRQEPSVSSMASTTTTAPPPPPPIDICNAENSTDSIHVIIKNDISRPAEAVGWTNISFCCSLIKCRKYNVNNINWLHAPCARIRIKRTEEYEQKQKRQKPTKHVT